MHWPQASLGDVVEFLDHQRRPITSKDRVHGNVPYYGANGRQGFVESSLFNEPLVLLAEDGGHFSEPEKGIAYMIEGPSWVNNHAHVLRPRPSIEVRYLARVLENMDVRSYVSGSTRAKLTKTRAADISIPLPPLPEQRRIASVLDVLETIRDKRRRAIALSVEAEQAALGALLSGGPGSRRVAVREIAEIQTGPFGSLLHKADYVVGGIPLVNPTHIRDGRIAPDSRFSVSEETYSRLENYSLRTGDVVLGRRGEMGRAASITSADGRLVCGTGSLIIRPWNGAILGSVLAGALSSRESRKSLEKMARGVTMLNLNQSIVGNLEVNVPSTRDQATFESFRAAIVESRGLHQRHLTKLDELFASLQHRAFLGGISF